MNRARTCLFVVSFECLRRCTSSELENRCPLTKIFSLGERHMVRDLGNNLALEVPKCDVLTGNLTPEGT
ncbi:hypothetical protein AVEN_274715-1, partial [Araneus ventricosus]